MEDKSFVWLGIQEPKARKTKVSLKVTIPVLRQALDAGLVKDTYWFELLSDVSCGKLPKGFRIKNNTVFFRNKSKIYSSELPDKPSAIVESLISFFKSTAHLRSQQDVELEEKQKQLHTIRSSEKQNSWKKNKQRKVREAYIFAFCTKLRKDLSLEDSEFEQLYDLLFTSLYLGDIPTDSVKLEDNRIKEIEGLIYDEFTGIFYLQTKKAKKSKRILPAHVEELFSMGSKKKNASDKWNKYIDSIDKKRRANATYESESDNEDIEDEEEEGIIGDILDDIMTPELETKVERVGLCAFDLF